MLRKYDVLLIADEVVTAFGRLGHWFGTEVFGLQPDLITLAKGITSAYVPLSASLVSGRLAEALAEGNERFGVFQHGFTYSAHPLAAAAALTNLGIVEREDLVAQAGQRGAYLQERLQEAFGDSSAGRPGPRLRADRGWSSRQPRAAAALRSRPKVAARVTAASRPAA